MASSAPNQRIDGQSHAELRRELVNSLKLTVRDERVLEAMACVPRHLFVPQGLQTQSYADRPLPIGFGQTISQPQMVAILLQAAELDGSERVLDVGGGSGYQAALLGQLAKEVYSIELLPELADGARAALALINATNVTVLQGDGSRGYSEKAPYDVVVVAAAAERVPAALVEQLAEGGRLLIPVGKHTRGQTLTRIRKRGGVTSSEELELCSFVPLITASQDGR